MQNKIIVNQIYISIILILISSVNILAKSYTNTPSSSTNNKKYVIDLIDALRAGSTLGDIYQTSKYNDINTVLIPDIEIYRRERKREDPNITDEQISSEYQFYETELHRYKTRDFDYNIVNGRYNRGMALDHSTDDAQPWQGKDESFIHEGPTNSITLPRVEKPVMLKHRNQKTKPKNSYIKNKTARLVLIILVAAGLIMMIIIAKKK